MMLWHVFATLDSTNDYLKRTYAQYKEPCVIWAQKQTKGRGRFARSWESGDDLTFSLFFPTPTPAYLLAPLSVVEALKAFHIQAKIKWPNDILIQGKKVCGILIEQVYEGSSCVAQIVGIGVNTTNKSGALANTATWVELAPHVLLEAIVTAYERLLRYRKEELLMLYRQYDLLQGQQLLLDDVLWTVQGIDEDGSLCLWRDGILRICKSEEISLRQLYGSDDIENHRDRV